MGVSRRCWRHVVLPEAGSRSGIHRGRQFPRPGPGRRNAAFPLPGTYSGHQGGRHRQQGPPSNRPATGTGEPKGRLLTAIGSPEGVTACRHGAMTVSLIVFRYLRPTGRPESRNGQCRSSGPVPVGHRSGKGRNSRTPARRAAVTQPGAQRRTRAGGTAELSGWRRLPRPAGRAAGLDVPARRRHDGCADGPARLARPRGGRRPTRTGRWPAANGASGTAGPG